MKLEEMEIYKKWISQFGDNRQDLLKKFKEISDTKCIVKNNMVYMDGVKEGDFSRLSTIGLQMGIFGDILKEFLSEEDKVILKYEDLDFSKEIKTALVKIDDEMFDMTYYLDELGYQKIYFTNYHYSRETKINLIGDDATNDSLLHKKFFNSLRVELL